MGYFELGCEELSGAGRWAHTSTGSRAVDGPEWTCQSQSLQAVLSFGRDQPPAARGVLRPPLLSAAVFPALGTVGLFNLGAFEPR